MNASKEYNFCTRPSKIHFSGCNWFMWNKHWRKMFKFASNYKKIIFHNDKSRILDQEYPLNASSNHSLETLNGMKNYNIRNIWILHKGISISLWVSLCYRILKKILMSLDFKPSFWRDKPWFLFRISQYNYKSLCESKALVVIGVWRDVMLHLPILAI